MNFKHPKRGNSNLWTNKTTTNYVSMLDYYLTMQRTSRQKKNNNVVIQMTDIPFHSNMMYVLKSVNQKTTAILKVMILMFSHENKKKMILLPS